MKMLIVDDVVDTWICSDHHLGEDRWKIMGRP